MEVDSNVIKPESVVVSETSKPRIYCRMKQAGAWLLDNICKIYNTLRSTVLREVIVFCEPHKRKKDSELQSERADFNEWVSVCQKPSPNGCATISLLVML